MRVLLVESTPGNASAVKKWLNEAGHDTTSCFESPVTFGCRGVDHHDDCPLEQATDVALLVRDLDGGPHTLTEMGAVCAMRHRVPVVEVVEPDPTNLDTAMLEALAQVQSRHVDYVDAVRRSLARTTTLANPEQVGITVTKAGGRVHAMVELPAGLPESQVPMVVDWVGRALREHDPYANVIDVGLARPS